MSGGPDTLGRGRHHVLLNRLFQEAGPVDFGPAGLVPGYFIIEEGPVYDLKVKEGVMRTRIDRYGHAYVTIGVPLSTLLLDEEEYRNRLSKFLMQGALAFAASTKKKKLDFDVEAYLLLVRCVLDRYIAVPLPLPATSSELEQAHYRLGILRNRLCEPELR